MLVPVERCQNTQSITVCCVWGCVAADGSGCPSWPVSTAKSAYNGHVSMRIGPWSNGRRWLGLMNVRMVWGTQQLEVMTSPANSPDLNRASVGCAEKNKSDPWRSGNYLWRLTNGRLGQPDKIAFGVVSVWTQLGFGFWSFFNCLVLKPCTAL